MRAHQAESRIKAIQVGETVFAEVWRLSETAVSGNRRKLGLAGAESEERRRRERMWGNT